VKEKSEASIFIKKFMSFIVIYVTHPSKPEAVQLSAKLLNEHLVACVNYFPIESTYWWDGRLTSSTEILTFYKTTLDKWEMVRDFIEKNHKYEVPCIIKFATVEANQSYERWIQDQVFNI
jgi:periplasmic divalent cation tolerance protein